MFVQSFVGGQYLHLVVEPEDVQSMLDGVKEGKTNIEFLVEVETKNGDGSSG